MAGLRDFLRTIPAGSRVVIPRDVGMLIEAFDFVGQGPTSDLPGEFSGTVQLTQGGQQSPVPGVNLGLGVPAGMAGTAPVKISWGPDFFKIWIVLSEADKVYFAFKPIQGAPGLALTPATMNPQDADGRVSFVEQPGAQVQLVSRGRPGDQLAPSLLIQGDETHPAAPRFTPDTTPEEGIVPFSFEPPTMLIKGTSIGLKFGTITFDDSSAATGPNDGPQTLKILHDPTADIAWRGIVCKQLTLYLPMSVPIFGGRAIDMWFAASFDGGVNAVVDTTVQATSENANEPERMGFSAHIECVDPTAKGFGGLLPTFISATMELPIKPTALSGGPINFVGGKPVRARLTLSRDPVNSNNDMRMALSFDAQGPDGLLSVRNQGSNTAPEHIFNVGAGVATAILANQQGAGSSSVAAVVAAAGAAASAFFKPESQFILNAVELQSTGHGIPVGGEIRFSLDYSVALSVVKLGVEGLSVEMKPDQPMRFRIRKVALVYGTDGVAGFELDYQHAEMEIENPGAWDIGELEQLLDAIGGRSGRGSLFVEVDLRFKLNLGPVQVSGITLRASKDGNKSVEITATKMSASLSIPGVLSGDGEVKLGGSAGFAASLHALIDPLNITADALVITQGSMVVLGLGVDLPAPIPLANSGLGLFGISGLFGRNGSPKYQPDLDPILQKLKWQPDGIDSYIETVGNDTFGFGAVIGTLPDMGTAFSAKASLLITVPDVMVRAGINARALSERISISAMAEDGPGYSALGLFTLDSSSIDFAVIASGNFAPLLTVTVPMAGHFSRSSGADWFVYLGADGAPRDGRAIGPVSVKVLPGILDVGADAYFMVRGDGIEDWPHGRAVPGGPWKAQGFVVAFGFALHDVFGPKPVAYAELNASLDLLLGTNPLTLAGFGSAGGSLHLGPFSAGVQASVAFRHQEQTGGLVGKNYLWAEVVARIELLFTHIEGRVTISHGDGKGRVEVPEPLGHPLDRLNDNKVTVGTTPALTDDTYRLLAYLSESPDEAPTVWPDIIVSIPFNVMPDVQGVDLSQFPDLKAATQSPPQPVGTEMLQYIWYLKRVAMKDVTDAPDKLADDAGTALAGTYAASWQVPRGGAATLSELVLCSPGEALWAQRVADGGKSLDNNPTENAANFCTLVVVPAEGWAVGLLAVCSPRGTRVPPEFVSNSLLNSAVAATVTSYAESLQQNVATGNPLVLNLDGLAPIPSPYRVFPGTVERWPTTQGVRFDAPFQMKHEFGGHYWPPNLTSDLPSGAPQAVYVQQVVQLQLDEPASQGQLLLLVPDEVPLMVVSRNSRNPRDEMKWQLAAGERTTLKSPAGEVLKYVLAQAIDPNAFFDTVIVHRPVGRTAADVIRSCAIGIVGVRGITMSAQVAANNKNKATQEKANALADLRSKQYQPQFEWAGPHKRNILQPGRLYRLDIDMSWEGTATEQDVDGHRTPVTPKRIGEKPRKFFFRTTPKPEGNTPKSDKSLLPAWAQAAVSVDAAQFAADEAAKLQNAHLEQSIACLNTSRTDHFDAELVQRYFGGYTPGQSELFRFTGDDLQAHFTQDHVVHLAQVYGFDLQLACRRVDKAGEQYKDPVLLEMTRGPLLNPDVLSGPQRIVYEAVNESPCDQPTPGMTGSAKFELEPRAWYELYVHALEGGQALEAGRFKGVTFRTSRWAGPAQMLADLFTGSTDSHPYMVGDLLVDEARVAAIRASTVLGDDRAFEAATLAIGADGWPAPEDPRLSWLWVSGAGPGQGYRLIGLMLESPEPVIRDGRGDLQKTVDLNMGFQHSQEAALALSRSDRAGCRFIFVASTAIQVRDSETLALLHHVLTRRFTPTLVFKATAKPEGDITQPVPLALQPSFATVAGIGL